ncbi:MAG: hypothetical protein LH606_15280 [Cytophagaceae bacterium]|nr:hypothetical protein [Cytophagaceae bacterium]
MKTLHKVKSKRQFPEFWDEDWLKAAIQEVDRSAMSADKRLAYEMLIAQNAAAVHSEKKKIEEAENRREFTVKKSAITKSLLKGLTPELVAEVNDVPLSFVLSIQSELIK